MQTDIRALLLTLNNFNRPQANKLELKSLITLSLATTTSWSFTTDLYSNNEQPD
jgi:hypothetical protein